MSARLGYEQHPATYQVQEFVDSETSSNCVRAHCKDAVTWLEGFEPVPMTTPGYVASSIHNSLINL